MSDLKHFLSPRLTGKRFDDHSVPVEILQDFVALQDLITEIAKNIYLEANPTKKRVPKGFTEGVTLNLEKVEDGSAILKFFLVTNLLASSILGKGSHQYTYFEKAKDKVIEVIRAAENDEEIKGILADKYLNYFNKIGRNLKEDETIFLNPESLNGSAKLNKRVRNKIMLTVSEDSTYKDEFKLTALITSIDKVDKTFTLLIDNQKLAAKLDPNNFKIVINTFTEFYSNVYVSVSGEGIYNQSDKIIKIDSISNIEILDPLDVSVRLNELAKLKNGWYESIGKAPSIDALVMFEGLYDKYYPENLPLPAIFPTIEGNIQLEWSVNSKEISLEIDLNQFSAELLSVDSNTSEVFEDLIDLKEESEWRKLNNYLL